MEAVFIVLWFSGLDVVNGTLFLCRTLILKLKLLRLHVNFSVCGTVPGCNILKATKGPWSKEDKTSLQQRDLTLSNHVTCTVHRKYTTHSWRNTLLLCFMHSVSKDNSASLYTFWHSTFCIKVNYFVYSFSLIGWGSSV